MSSNATWQDVAAMGFFIALGGFIGMVLAGLWRLIETIGALQTSAVVFGIGMVLFIGAFVVDVYII